MIRGLSILIASRTAGNLHACIKAVRSKEGIARIYVLDDGFVGPLLPFAAVYPNPDPPPFCFARAMNYLIRHTDHQDDLLLLNDDALLQTPQGVAAMRALSHVYGEYGILSPRIIGPAWPVHAVRDSYTEVITDVTDLKTIPFVCVLIRRSVLNLVGPLEERFAGVYGGEDDDYCYRVRQAGFRLGVYNGCMVDHGSLPSTYRGLGGSLSIEGAKDRFREIHGFEMRSR